MIGARPEIIQAAPLALAFESRLEEIIVHTGQHYDEAMSGGQILDTRLPEPRHNLGVGSRSDADQLELGERLLGETIDAEAPDGVLVRGDTNATLAGARAAAERGLPLFHVEAGLRSYRDDMPEERNRILTDELSDVLYAPTENARDRLEADASIKGRVELVGDPLCDNLTAWRDKVVPEDRGGDYVLCTVHRNYNTDTPERLAAVLDCLSVSPWPVVFPIHPRTRASLEKWNLAPPPNMELMDPVTYTRMLALERGARAIATDSGGVQREAYLWGVPCLTVREETEWVETVDTGWNTLVAADRDAFAAALERPLPTEHPPVFGDGHASERIAESVVAHLEAVGVK